MILILGVLPQNYSDDITVRHHSALIMKTRDLKHLEEEYLALSPVAAQFAIALNDQLRQLLAERKIYLGCPVEWRVKAWQSLLEKLDRKSLSIGAIKDLHDFIGIRLILLFRRDVRSTCEIIETQFKIVSSEDTARRLSEEQFGYGSMHYVVELPDSWLDVPTLRAFRDLKAEIQVRTLAQHMWAAASHALQYKHEAGVPPPLRRTIYRASALLETADLEFERVLAEKEAYKETLSEAAGTELLNVDSLERLLDELLPPENKDDLEPESYSDLLPDLNHFGVRTPDDLRQLLTKHRDAVMNADRARVKEGPQSFLSNDENARIGRGVFYTHVGLAREALSKSLGKKWEEYVRRVRSQRMAMSGDG
jgi:ppGpp synthetase/RelA/SpoT-type nucleotidyltranferase